MTVVWAEALMHKNNEPTSNPNVLSNLILIFLFRIPMAILSWKKTGGQNHKWLICYTPRECKVNRPTGSIYRGKRHQNSAGTSTCVAVSSSLSEGSLLAIWRQATWQYRIVKK